MVNKEWVIKEFEGKSASELVKAPAYALQGVSPEDAKKLKEAFGIDNIQEMANLKFYKWALELKKEAGK